MTDEKKGFFDMNSIHEKMIDHNIDEENNKLKEGSSGLQDFTAVLESIKKLEKIIEDGEELALKDKNYNEYLIDARNSIDEQKFQLFKLRLSGGENAIAIQLAAVSLSANSNDFISIEREIKKYSDTIFSLKNESEISRQYKSLWNSHHKKIDPYHNQLQKKKIEHSVNVSKNRVELAVVSFEKSITNARHTSQRNDLNSANKSLKALQVVIDEAEMTAQKDISYSKWLNEEKSKYSNHLQKIDDVRLQIDIGKHKKSVEDLQPTVLKGLNELNRNIEGIDFVKNTKNLIKDLPKNQKDDNEFLWEKIEDNSISVKQGADPLKNNPGSSLLSNTIKIILYTFTLIGIIYYTSQSYISLRPLQEEMVNKNEILKYAAVSITNGHIEKTKIYDEYYSNRIVNLLKTLSTTLPSSITIDQIAYLDSKDEKFNYIISGILRSKNSNLSQYLNTIVSRIADQKIINRATITDQKNDSAGVLTFTLNVSL